MMIEEISTGVFAIMKQLLLNSFPFLFKNQYHFALDGYYNKKNQLVFILQVKNKRIFKEMTSEEIIGDNSLIKEINPLDSCVLGMIANLYRNNLLMESASIQRIKKLKSYFPLPKIKPVLFVKSKVYQESGKKLVKLYLLNAGKELIISIFDLYKNPALILGMDSLDALALGYDISDEMIKNYKGTVE